MEWKDYDGWGAGELVQITQTSPTMEARRRPPDLPLHRDTTAPGPQIKLLLPWWKKLRNRILGLPANFDYFTVR